MLIAASIVGAWLALALLFATMCRMAARGDGRNATQSSNARYEASHPLSAGLVVWDEPQQPAKRPR